MANHFGHKVQVERDDSGVRIFTRFGKIDLQPGDGVLVVVLEPAREDELAELRDVALRHLERFAREPFEVTWKSG
jgi:hypothetical protein